MNYIIIGNFPLDGFKNESYVVRIVPIPFSSLVSSLKEVLSKNNSVVALPSKEYSRVLFTLAGYNIAPGKIHNVNSRRFLRALHFSEKDFIYFISGNISPEDSYEKIYHKWMNKEVSFFCIKVSDSYRRF